MLQNYVPYEMHVVGGGGREKLLNQSESPRVISSRTRRCILLEIFNVDMVQC